MSGPPPSHPPAISQMAYPRTHGPSSAPQIPPFPQPLHLKEEPWTASSAPGSASGPMVATSSTRTSPNRDRATTDDHDMYSGSGNEHDHDNEDEDDELEEVDEEQRNGAGSGSFGQMTGHDFGGGGGSGSQEGRRGSGMSHGGIGQAARDRKPVATRRRVVQSCSECRRRKIKCDKKFPCGPCILRSDQARCHEVGMAEKNVISTSTNYASTSDLAALAHRVDALESSLLKSGALSAADLEAFLRARRISPPAQSRKEEKPPAMRPAFRSQLSVASAEDVNGEEEAALTLEHLAFGRSRMDGAHSLPNFGARLPSTVSKHEANNNYHLVRAGTKSSPWQASTTMRSRDSPGSARKPSLTGAPRSLTAEERAAKIDELMEIVGPTDIFDIFFKQTAVGQRALSSVLPPTDKGRWLVKQFISRVDWLQRCIHVPTFMRQCEDLWTMQPEQVPYEISMAFLGLYLTICSLGLVFAEPAEANQQYTQREREELPELWGRATRSTLWAGDFTARPELESIQSLILIGVLLDNINRMEATWNLLGLAIKMAQALGLSRLGAEQQAVDGKPLPMWKGRWESLVQREVGRRVWWNLVFLDWTLAPNYNYNTAIHPDQIKTAVPANVDDEDLVDGQPLRAKPMTERTSMSFLLVRLKFVEISHRQIWQANNNNHPPYSFILSVDGELRKAMMDLPSYFQPDGRALEPPTSGDPKDFIRYYENNLLTLACHARMLRLHRAWMSRGYADERFAYSKEQAIRAARASLKLMSESKGGTPFLISWIPLFYVCVSGLVVIIDLLRTPKNQMNTAVTAEKLREVRGALEQMRAVTGVSHPARSAVRVMDLLLVEVEERRKSVTQLGKRKLSAKDGEDVDDPHGLQEAVKKLIRLAQLEADSPSGPLSSSDPTPPAGSDSHPSGVHSPRRSTTSVPELRMSTDHGPPTERGVFGAYPIPAPVPQIATATINGTSGPVVPSQQGQNGTGSGGQKNVQWIDDNISTFPPSMSNSMLGTAAQPTQYVSSPYSFSVDPTSAFDFDPRAIPGNPQPQLNPEVESLLQSYFPGPPQQAYAAGGSGDFALGAGAGSAGAGPAAPDDFLSKMFTFGWNPNGAQGQGGPQRQGSGSAEGGFVFGGDPMGAGGLEGWGRSAWMG